MTLESFDCAPVLLIGFNRPDYMAAQIEAIRPVHPEKIYIAVDGPRDDRPGERELCQKVRECTALINWHCEIKTLFREKNLGCKYSVSGAITWFFENEPEGIVLEDDCRLTVYFLRFATEMLIKYRDTDQIGAVCGFNFFNLQSDKTASYHFSRHMDVWGWASWHRVWKDYDVDAANDFEKVSAIIDRTKATTYYKKFYTSIARAVSNGLSTWDMQFSLLFMQKSYLSVVPKVRLIANVGLADARATHTGGYVYWASEWTKAESLEFPLVHSGEIVCDDAADSIREQMEGAILPRGLTWLGAKCPKLRGMISGTGWMLEKILPFLFRL